MFCLSLLLSTIALAYSELNLKEVFSGEWYLTPCEIDLVDQDQLCDSSVFFYWNTASGEEGSGSGLFGKWFTNTTTNNASIEEKYLNINIHGGASGLIQSGDDVHEIEDIIDFRFIPLPNHDYVSYGIIPQNIFNNYLIYNDDEDEPPQKSNKEINYSYKWTLSQQLNRFELMVFNTNLNDNNKIFVISASKIFRDNRSWFAKNMTYIMLGGLFLFNVVFRTYFNPNSATRPQTGGTATKKTN